MTNPPDDRIDPYESKLARRVGDFAEQVVRPIDATAIAAAARAGAQRRTIAGRLFGSTASMARLGVVLAGALVGVAALGVLINAGGNSIPLPSASNAGPTATPTDVRAGAAACSADALTARVTAWEGAAGSRIASVTVHNGGKISCLLSRYLRPALVDADGHALLVAQGVPQPATIEFPGGADATTMVDMSNYCGPAPTAALRIRLYLADDSSIETTDANAGDPPPCNGPNAPGEIQMQPFRLAK